MNCSRTDEGKSTIVHVRGELDALSAPELRPVFDRLVEDGRREIVIDLSDLRLIDSSGVGALVGLFKRTRANGGDVRFVGLNSQPLVIFKMLRLDVVFGVSS